MGEKKHINKIPPKIPGQSRENFVYVFCSLYKFIPRPIWLDDRGTGRWKWMGEVPRRTSLVPLAFPCFVHCLIGVETKNVLDYQGRAGDHFHCTVEPSPGHIRCRFMCFFRSPVTQKWLRTPFSSQFWVTRGHSGVGRWETLWSHFRVTLSHFNSFCVSVELGGRPLHKAWVEMLLSWETGRKQAKAFTQALSNLWPQKTKSQKLWIWASFNGFPY